MKSPAVLAGLFVFQAKGPTLPRLGTNLQETNFAQCINPSLQECSRFEPRDVKRFTKERGDVVCPAPQLDRAAAPAPRRMERQTVASLRDIY